MTKSLLTRASRTTPHWAKGGVAGAVLAAGIVLLVPTRFESSASFTPSVSAQSNLTGLVQSLGLDASSDATQSPDFYSELLTTDEILRRVLSQAFPAPDSGTVMQEYSKFDADSLQRLDRAMKKLRSSLTVSASRRTGIVKIDIQATTRSRATFLASVLLNEVDRYNQQVRRRKAAADRVFVEGRLQSARSELAVVEEKLKNFMATNRNVSNSPELRLEADQLTREVVLHQSLVTSLAQNFEQSRIDEVRDTPDISVVQPPIYPRRPASRNGSLWSLLGALAGAFGGLMWGADGRRRVQRWRTELFAKPEVEAG
jgi:uncharacterized protein involved in exopolysaccharide biosynthesis